MPTILLQIACLCGAIDQSLTACPPPGHDASKPIPLTICHCTTCRQTSGVLCTSYCPVEPPKGDLGRLTVYTLSPGTRRYFCKTCGCHILQSRQAASGDVAWEVATGVIAEEKRHDTGNNSNNDDIPVLEYVRHEHVDDTGDGGLALWLPTVNGRPMEGYQQTKSTAGSADNIDSLSIDRTVPASCHCGSVQFDVRPPDFDPVASRQPHSGFSDLLVPYATTDAAVTSNPDDAKWWLRPSKSDEKKNDKNNKNNKNNKNKKNDKNKTTRWLAGTCACRSCRLATGFEIQTWTFVSRGCITVEGKTLSFGAADEEEKNTPPALSAYQSSPGVERNFCSRCGATAFWHDIWRPDLIDISVGLLRPNSLHQGSRVESFLDWCTSRVSFIEEATRGRHGQSARRGASLAESLETHMKVS